MAAVHQQRAAGALRSSRQCEAAAAARLRLGRRVSLILPVHRMVPGQHSDNWWEALVGSMPSSQIRLLDLVLSDTERHIPIFTVYLVLSINILFKFIEDFRLGRRLTNYRADTITCGT